MVGIPWDQPGADPVGDLRRAIVDIRKAAERETVFLCPIALWQAFKAEHGREMTPADIPIGHWDRIEVDWPCRR